MVHFYSNESFPDDEDTTKTTQFSKLLSYYIRHGRDKHMLMDDVDKLFADKREFSYVYGDHEGTSQTPEG